MGDDRRVVSNVNALGVTVRIVADEALSADDTERVVAAWQDAAARIDDNPDDTVTASGLGDIEQMLESLTTRVTLAAIEQQRGNLWMFHAAGVALPDGRVVAFVGPSGRGKTTLSRALGQKYGYVSDETVAVNDQLDVFEYRKPLSVVRSGEPKDQIAPSVLGLLPLPNSALRLTAMVLLDRQPGFEEPEIEDVPLVEVLSELVPQMSYLADRERPLRELAAFIDSVGGVVRIRYTEAQTLPALVPHLASRGAQQASWTPIDPMPDVADQAELSAVAVDDAIDADGHIVIIAGSKVRAIGGIAPEIWHSVRSGVPQDQLAEVVTARYGAPPEGNADDLVGAAVDELVASGLLQRSS